jgi:hypothetical protein
LTGPLIEVNLSSAVGAAQHAGADRLVDAARERAEQHRAVGIRDLTDTGCGLSSIQQPLNERPSTKSMVPNPWRSE